MWYDEQRHLSLLSVLRGRVDHDWRGSRGPRDRAARAARAAGSRSAREPHPADVHAPAADAGLRGPVRGRVLLARPGNRVLPQRQPAHGTPALVGPGRGGPRRVPSPGGRDRQRRALLGTPWRRELRNHLPPLVLPALADTDAPGAPSPPRGGRS